MGMAQGQPQDSRATKAVPMRTVRAGIDYKPRIGDWSWTSSKHVGGLHVLLADGSTRFMSENVDASIRVGLDRIADGNVLGEF